MNGDSVRRVRALSEQVRALCDRAISEANPTDYMSGTALTGELRRRSMDLTRALAEMRRP